ncbi:fumarylacetoacetate hydrolase family protein [Roseateles sp.]|uniref:fumarylacetoacetate hydrolase family protein n=1 Tax=Roseateles sp. TaxID=1971397 RepID=UPI003BA6F90A
MTAIPRAPSKPLQALIEALGQAWLSGPALPASDWSDVVAQEAQAYAVQDGLADALGWRQPGRPQYWKSGGPGRHAPLTHALLAPAGLRQDDGSGDPLSFADRRLHAPGAEAEIALRLGRDVRAQDLVGLNREEAADFIDALTVAIEWVDSRWQEGEAAPALLRQADCLSHGGLALGEWLPWPDYRLHNWSQQACELQINEEPPQQGCGRHSLGDPAWGLLDWLRHATRKGQVLPAGSVVTTGAWLARGGLKRGDRVRAHFDGLGSICLTL